MDSFSFGNNPQMTDDLLNLVLAGKKKATSWASVYGSLDVKVGRKAIVKDGQGRQRAIIETTELSRKRFSEVDESFAFDEGEGDRSLKYWRKEHKDFFTCEGTYSANMEVYCERFVLVKILELK